MPGCTYFQSYETLMWVSFLSAYFLLLPWHQSSSSRKRIGFCGIQCSQGGIHMYAVWHPANAGWLSAHPNWPQEERRAFQVPAFSVTLMEAVFTSQCAVMGNYSCYGFMALPVKCIQEHSKPFPKNAVFLGIQRDDILLSFLFFSFVCSNIFFKAQFIILNFLHSLLPSSVWQPWYVLSTVGLT